MTRGEGGDTRRQMDALVLAWVLVASTVVGASGVSLAAGTGATGSAETAANGRPAGADAVASAPASAGASGPASAGASGSAGASDSFGSPASASESLADAGDRRALRARTNHKIIYSKTTIKIPTLGAAGARFPAVRPGPRTSRTPTPNSRGRRTTTARGGRPTWAT
ncbi:hypothetical protein [Halorussus caseinilyticus]|uniref:hypothetical protein n=1 Tax=Halorussus caseinilyticus TaxID=3034025 RepID=UPI0023E7E1E2|nr:hypothetical protein [Halorussus sp. DT72]